MTRYTTWPGSVAELHQLQEAINHNCGCSGDDDKRTCVAHKMLLDQATLNHLAFVARRRAQFVEAEFDPRSEFGL